MTSRNAPREKVARRGAGFRWGWGLLALAGLAGIGFLVAGGGLLARWFSPSRAARVTAPAPPPPLAKEELPIVTITPLDPPASAREIPPAPRSRPTPPAPPPTGGDSGAPAEGQPRSNATASTPGETGGAEPDPRQAERDLQAALDAVDARFAPRIAEARRELEALRERNERRSAAARAVLEQASEDTRHTARAAYEQARAGVTALEHRSRERWGRAIAEARHRISGARADYEEAREEGRRGRRSRERYERVRRQDERTIAEAEARLQRELGEHRRLLEDAERRFEATQEAADTGSRRADELRARIAEWEAEVERAADRLRALEAEREQQRAEARRTARLPAGGD